jgi:hypothetical protein
MEHGVLLLQPVFPWERLRVSSVRPDGIAVRQALFCTTEPGTRFSIRSGGDLCQHSRGQ